MKILHISTYDRMGGAARAAYWQHCGLRESGMNSRMVVRYRGTADPQVSKVIPTSKKAARIERALKRKFIDWKSWHSLKNSSGFIMDASDLSAESIAGEIEWADVVNIHHCNGFLSIHELLNVIPRQKPVVITLHEMSFFTGGCIYSGSCRRFESGCGDCPLLKKPSSHDLSHEVWKAKYSALQERSPQNTCVIADSTWIEAEARKSRLLTGFNIQTIHYGIDPEVYQVHDKASVRKLLGLPLDKTIILFASENVADPRKGFGLLCEAMRLMSERNDLQFVSFGRVLDYSGFPQQIKHFGFIEDDSLMSLLYSAADLFFMPSLEEAFGLSCLEAMSCGTPVLAFKTGGIPDMIEDGVTGFFAVEKSSKALSQKINSLLTEKVNFQAMGKICRDKVLEKFLKAKNTLSYVDIYKSLPSRGFK